MTTIKLYESTTLKSAQSKKCRLLAALRDRTCSLKLATLKWSHDRLLQTVCTTEELQAAADGTFAATSKRKFVTVSFTEDEADTATAVSQVVAIPNIDLLQTKPKTVAAIENKYATELANEPAY